MADWNTPQRTGDRRRPPYQGETLRYPTLSRPWGPVGPAGWPPPSPPRRRIAPLVIGASAVLLLALAAGLAYAFMPQFHPRTATISPTPTATALPTATPRPTSATWRLGPAAPANLADITFAPSAPQTGYRCVDANPIPSSSARWLQKSDDGGITWRPVSGIATPSVKEPVLMGCRVFVDTNDVSDVFAELLLLPNCQCASGEMPPASDTLWRSRDGGATWSQLAMPTTFRGFTNLVISGSRLIAMGSDDNQVPPTCSVDPNLSAPHQVNDLYASDDGGQNWYQIGQSLIAQGLSLTRVNSGGAPVLQTAGSTVFVQTYCEAATNSEGYAAQQGYWRSDDSGVTWTKVRLPDNNSGYLRVTPTTSGGTAGVAVQLGNPYTRSTPVILTSHDGGATWTPLPPLTGISGLKVNGGVPQVTWVLAMPDGTVLASLRNASSASGITVARVYAIDPQATNPTWRAYAPVTFGAVTDESLTGWPLATTKYGLTLWGMAFINQRQQPVYLAPLP